MRWDLGFEKSVTWGGRALAGVSLAFRDTKFKPVFGWLTVTCQESEGKGSY